MNMDWKNFYLNKKTEILASSIFADEVDVQTSDETEVSQSIQLKETTDALISRKQSMLYKLDRALARIASGEFGSCEECGESISEARLKALPDCVTCISCAEEEERNKKIYGTSTRN